MSFDRLTKLWPASEPTPPKACLWAPGGAPRNFWWVVTPGSQKNLAPFQTKKCHFHTRFQIWRRSQNATYMFTWTEIITSLLRLECQQIRILWVYFLLIWNQSKTIPDSRPKWAKSIPVFKPKRRKKPYSLGRHTPIWLI